MGKDKQILIDYNEYLQLEAIKNLVDDVKSKIELVNDSNMSMSLEPSIFIDINEGEKFCELLGLNDHQLYRARGQFRIRLKFNETMRQERGGLY